MEEGETTACVRITSARCFAKYFTRLVLSSRQILNGGAVIIPISELGKLRHREVRSLAQGHTAATCRLPPESTLVMLQGGGERLYPLDYTVLQYIYVI